MKTLIRYSFIILALAGSAQAQEVVYQGKGGPGQGQHIVLIAGDEEYRSEEAMPQLGKILALRHGFKCTVLFPLDTDGSIHPNKSNIPGMEALKTADLVIIALRFRNLPDEQMKYFADYVESGKPIMGLRTSTHAFNIPNGKTYAQYSFNNNGGFGRKILGETWVDHHGAHGSQSTRGLIAKGAEDHPIVRGIKNGDVWGPTDVYTVHLPLAEGSQPIIMGEVLVGMKATDEQLKGPKNDPMMPVAWTRVLKNDGKTTRVFTTTMGASQDLLSEGFRRLLVNAAYWCLGMEDQISPRSSVALVGDYAPTPFRFNGFKKGVRPVDHQMK